MLATLLQERRPRLDLSKLEYADEMVGRELARTAEAIDAEGRTLVLLVVSRGIERFLRRHGVVPPARIERGRP